MDKNYLLASAGKLKQVSEKAANEYLGKSELVASKMDITMSERADIESLIGTDNMSMMKDNHANHVRFIASILKNHNPNVLVDTVLWVFRAYRSHGFATHYWSAQLNSWIIILKENLSTETFKEVYPYYEWMQVNIPAFETVADEKTDAANS
tara:strand:- start:16123 stop:16578 length:456 start_codon:yes stop_codon:yes gene_type:complete